MSSPPFFEVLDSTIVSAFRACPRLAYLQYLEHYKPKIPSVHLHAGGAFAKGLEVTRNLFHVEKVPAREAIAEGLKALLTFYGNFDCPADSAKSADRMAGALVYYFDQYTLESDKAIPISLPGGKRGIEFSFSEPIDALHPETSDPILYVGRMDMVVDFAGGMFGEDDKTTSSLGASWLKQWDLRSQFTGYCWGAARHNLSLQGFLVRGVSILKTKYDTQEAITYRPPWMIEQWYERLLRTVEDMKRAWESGLWDQTGQEGGNCNDYGGCPMRRVCLSSDPAPWLEAEFVRRKWDPVMGTETLL